MKNSIYFRIFIATALIVLFSFSLLGGLYTTLSYRRAIADRREMMLSTMHETARVITAQHQNNTDNLDDLNLSEWLTMTSGITGFDLFVTNVNGVIEACSEADIQNIGKTVPQEILRSVGAEENAVVVLSDIGNLYPETRHMSGVPLTGNSSGARQTFGYLFITSDMSAFMRDWTTFYNVFIMIAVGVMIIAFVIAFFAMKKQVEPLYEMACAARRFARGEFSVRVEDHGRKDEIGQLTEAFNAMADTLDSSEKLRRDFITNISHELRTPMTVIAGFAEGLLDGTIPRENETRYLSVISSETRRLSRLVLSMSDTTPLQPSELSLASEGSFDITEVARLALISLDAKIEKKKLSVEADLPEEEIITRGDSDSISQAIFNLIDNAIKFSAPRGLISLELWKQGDRAYVSVTNRGEDIPSEDLPHIFDRFHKADKSRSADRDGVGMGLFIVKKILDTHNEDIFVTSSGGLTRFIFSLTVVEEQKKRPS